MTAPAITVARFLRACLLGTGLGCWYGFLRPVRRKNTVVGDLLFVLGALWVGLILGFGICGGDLRLGYFSGLALGAWLLEVTFGRLLRPIFDGFWGLVAQIWRIFWIPLKKISIFTKILFASAKKWVTIKCNNRRGMRRISGGRRYARKEKCASQRADQISAQQADHQDPGDRRYRIVYGGAADLACGPDQH